VRTVRTVVGDSPVKDVVDVITVPRFLLSWRRGGRRASAGRAVIVKPCVALSFLLYSTDNTRSYDAVAAVQVPVFNAAATILQQTDSHNTVHQPVCKLAALVYTVAMIVYMY
jgi:hypothetical protein